MTYAQERFINNIVTSWVKGKRVVGDCIRESSYSIEEGVQGIQILSITETDTNINSETVKQVVTYKWAITPAGEDDRFYFGEKAGLENERKFYNRVRG